jgi:hypothetical protein
MFNYWRVRDKSIDELQIEPVLQIMKSIVSRNDPVSSPSVKCPKHFFCLKYSLVMFYAFDVIIDNDPVVFC